MNWRVAQKPPVALMNSTDPFLGCLHVECLRTRVNGTAETQRQWSGDGEPWEQRGGTKDWP